MSPRAESIARRISADLFDLRELAPDAARRIRRVMIAKLVEMEQIDRVALTEQIEG